MRNAILGCVLLLASTPAIAEPCAVTITRAPDDVRVAIEDWVAAEPACATTAEVRVVVTDGGYYLLAIGSDGRIHERVVPDAQSAGVLVASWIAADGAPVITAPVAAEPAEVPEPAPVMVATAAPLAPGAPVVIATVAPVPAPAPEERWLTVGPTIVMVEQGWAGLRATVDVKRWRRWSVGVTAAVATSPDTSQYGASAVRGLVETAHHTTRGKWSLRLAAGLGAGAVRYAVPLWDDVTEVMHETSTGALFEGSAVVSRRVRDRWAASAGLIVDGPMSEYITADSVKDLTLLLGVSRGF